MYAFKVLSHNKYIQCNASSNFHNTFVCKSKVVYNFLHVKNYFNNWFAWPLLAYLQTELDDTGCTYSVNCPSWRNDILSECSYVYWLDREV